MEPIITYYENGTILLEWIINGEDRTKEIAEWIEEYNIQLDENHCIVNGNDKMFFKMKWG